MTVSPRTLEYDTPAPNEDARADRAASAPDDVTPLQRHPLDRKIFAGLTLTLLALYGLLQNPYWVPSGDSEVYISIARDLVRGYGYQFNGQPVAMVPPGWPWVMAAVMKVSPYFLPLKLVAMGCVIGSMLLGYWCVRRFTTPGVAALVIVMTALLTHVYQATFWLISEGLFCLVTSATFLLAFQVREGKRQAWRIGLLAALCGAAVLVRWAGLIGAAVVVAILLDRQFWPRLNRQWLAAALCTAVTFGTFYVLREVMSVTDEQARAARAFGGAGESTDADAPAEPVAAAPTTMQTFSMQQEVSKGYDLITTTTKGKGYDDRFLGLGRWFSWLYWQPFRAAAGSPVIEGTANAVGWVVLLLLLIPTASAVRRKEWVWLGVMLYCLALGMNWPAPNARYYVPVAFLLTMGVFAAIDHLRNRPVRGWVWAWLALAAFAATMPLTMPAWMYLTWRDVWPVVAAALFMAGLVGVPQLIERWRGLPAQTVFLPALRTCVVLFVGGTLLCNALLWGVDVWVARAGDFYARYEAGMNQNLIAAARFLNEHGEEFRDGQVVITPSYVNLNRRRSSPFGLRALVLLTGRPVVALPGKWQDVPPSPKLARWMAARDFEYYVHQEPVNPWRVWHFRVAWWQMLRTGQVPEREVVSGWELYRVDQEAGRMHKVKLDPAPNWPTRVPGL